MGRHPKTEGVRRGRGGRCTAVSRGKTTASTSGYKNSRALSAWLCVGTEPRRSLPNIVRNQATSAPPMVHGCFMDAAFIRCAPQPAHEKFHPAEPSLPGFQAIVFVTQHLDHLLWQALGLGKIGDRVHRTKAMYKNTVFTFKELMSSGVRIFRCDSCNRALQLIPLDKLDSYPTK